MAVAVDKNGKWNASGWDGPSDKDAMALAKEIVESGEACYWLEADLPIPQEPTVVAATVSAAE